MSTQEPAPLVTLALFTYNQAEYIAQAFEAALAQTYSPLEVIVSDDCSTDNTFDLIRQLASSYAGPHRLVIRRNERNLGLVGHVGTVVRESHGDLIFAAAGDDVSYPDRVEKVVETWVTHGRPSGSIFSRYKTIDEQGTIRSNSSTHPVLTFQLSGLPLYMLDALSVGTLGCAHAWTRDIFEIFGDIDSRVIHEDVAISLRSLMVGSLIYMPDELVLYRLTSGSLSRLAFGDHRDRMRKMAKYWGGRVANHEQLDVDIELALKAGRIEAAAANWLREHLRSREEMARRHHAFFSSGIAGRMKVMLDSWNKVPLSQTLKWLVITLVPHSYAFRLTK